MAGSRRCAATPVSTAPYSSSGAEVYQRSRGHLCLRLSRPWPEPIVGFMRFRRVFTRSFRRANRSQEASEQRLQLALQVARMSTWEWDIRTGEVDRARELET